VVETPSEEASLVATQVKRIMEGAAHLDVPLTVETRAGASWGEAH